ncbi:sensor histidine kinase [Natronorubrum halophilum]|uniref:sensor histidine kinase n=1 Tax=Natronorubrum halophilum TaxID=1702106 RepID=UPI0010C18EC7|nr:HAMP domain-containing sensor histidine kinase [Natronorubrum halophilum]
MNGSKTNSTPPPSQGYRTLVTKFPNGVLVLFDDDLCYRIVGPEVLPFSKRKAADMVEKPIEDIFPAKTVSQLRPELRATIKGTSRSFDIEFDGLIHHIETRPANIDGEQYGVLVTQNVTDARQTAVELEQQNKRLDQFVDMVSHDLRNPLSVAIAHLDEYNETGDKKNIEVIKEALTRMDNLILELTTLARDTDTQSEHELVSITEVAQNAWDMIDSRSATLLIDNFTTVGNGSQLQVLFENLFRNAVGHGGTDVTVRIGQLADGFYVEDTGQGIPKQDRDRVLEHRVTTSYSGSGIGLTIVKRISRNHGLTLSLTESAEGGARFEFHQTNTK